MVGDIGDVGLAEKREQVMFAQGKEVDVLLNNHLFIVFAKQGAVEYFFKVLPVSSGKKGKRL
jgi:hypothetical protein